MLLVGRKLFDDLLPRAGPSDFDGHRLLVGAEAEVQARVVLVAFAGAGLDVAGQNAVANLDARDGTDGGAVDFVAVAGDDNQSTGKPGHILRKTEDARRENLERLKSIRSQMHDDLMGTLAWVRELVTMIHLAKFTGAPASRAAQ